MKLIKSYNALKYTGPGRMPGTIKQNGGIKKVNDPTTLIKQFALPVRKWDSYTQAEDGIFKRKKADGSDKGDIYVTSLFFVQEPDLGEGANAAELSADLKTLLADTFGCRISDDFPHLNMPDSNVCYLEFENESTEKLKELRSIIGKHVYVKDGALVIE